MERTGIEPVTSGLQNVDARIHMKLDPAEHPSRQGSV
jgi:hypothetical protein